MQIFGLICVIAQFLLAPLVLVKAYRSGFSKENPMVYVDKKKRWNRPFGSITWNKPS